MKYCPQCRADLHLQVLDGVERLVCLAPECGYVYWNNPTPVVAAIVQVGEHFILARNTKWPPHWFSMITGFLEYAEQPEEAILRETQEELGVKGEKAVFLGHYALPKYNQLIIGYWVQASGQAQLNEELAEVKLLTRQALQEYDFGRLLIPASMTQRLLALTASVITE